MSPFLCEQYLIGLRDETAAAENGARLVAHQWARGLLDARFDTLLLPVLLNPPDLPGTQDPLLDFLTARGLPSDWVRERIASGGLLLLLDGVDGVLVNRYPKCRLMTGAEIREFMGS